MKKSIFILFMVSLALPSLVFAASCRYLIGVWDISGNAVSYYKGINQPTYMTINNGRSTVINVISQNGCFFAGDIEFLNAYGNINTESFTGVINNKNIVMTSHKAVITANILNNKRIVFTCSGCDPHVDGVDYTTDYVTMQGIAIKR